MCHCAVDRYCAIMYTSFSSIFEYLTFWFNLKMKNIIYHSSRIWFMNSSGYWSYIWLRFRNKIFHIGSPAPTAIIYSFQRTNYGFVQLILYAYIMCAYLSARTHTHTHIEMRQRSKDWSWNMSMTKLNRIRNAIEKCHCSEENEKKMRWNQYRNCINEQSNMLMICDSSHSRLKSVEHRYMFNPSDQPWVAR